MLVLVRHGADTGQPGMKLFHIIDLQMRKEDIIIGNPADCSCGQAESQGNCRMPACLPHERYITEAQSQASPLLAATVG